jgi:hypothetical protein
MRSASKTTVALVLASFALALLTFGACCFAALDDAEFRALEEQGHHLTAPAKGVEVMQRAESKSQGVHALHGVRLLPVNA